MSNYLPKVKLINNGNINVISFLRIIRREINEVKMNK